MTIDGTAWFVGAFIICGAHALLMIWLRIDAQARFRRYAAFEAESQKRHDEFMVVLLRSRSGSGWNNKRGEA